MFQEYEISPRLLKKEKLQRCVLGNCKGACCLYGVWLGKYEQEQILRYWDEIKDFMPDGYQDNPSLCFQNELEKDPFVTSGKVVHSLVVEDSGHYGGTACVFLNKEHNCALQCAAEKMGHHPWFLKPFYCILHPLDLDEQGKITLDEAALLAEEPGSCLRPAPTEQPLLVTFEEELRYFLGNETYERLLR